MDKLVTKLGQQAARRLSSWRCASAAATPFRRKALFESLEPRLLLSADVLPGAVPAVSAMNPVVAEVPTVSLTPQVSELSTPLSMQTFGALEGGLRVSGEMTGTVPSNPGDLPQSRDFSLALSEGQTLSVGVTLDAGTLTGHYGVALLVLDPDGNEVALDSQFDRAQIQSFVAGQAGVYTVRMEVAFWAEPGEYDLPEQVGWSLVAVADGAIEREALDNGDNDSRETAQWLDAARPLPLGGASRTAVAGQLQRSPSPDPDYYRVTLAAGEAIEVETTITAADGYLQLLDADGRLVASAVRTGETMSWQGPQGLPRFVSDTGGDYYLKVEAWWSGQTDLAPLGYALVVARNASLDPDVHDRLGESGVQLLAMAPAPVSEAMAAEVSLAPAAAGMGASRSFVAVAQGDTVVVDIAPIADSGLSGVMPLLFVIDTGTGLGLPVTPETPPEGQLGWRYSVAATPGQMLRLTVEADLAGQWVMQVQGAAGVQAAPQVQASAFDDGLVAASSTYQWMLLSEPVRADRMGQPHLFDAEGVELESPTLMVFNQGDYLYARLPGDLPAGAYRLVFDDGTLVDLTGQPMAGFEYSFELDTVAPQLLSPAPGAVVELQAVDQSITLQFDEPMARYWPSPTFTDAQGQNAALQWSHAWSEDGTVLTVRLSGELPEGIFTMTLPAWSMADEAGNPVDGDAAQVGVQPLQVRFAVDREVDVMPALAAREPLGSLVYASGLNAQLTPGDVDQFTIELAEGVTFTAVLSTQLGQSAATLPQLDLTLLDPLGNEVAYAASSAPGRALLLPGITTTMAGAWTLRVSSPEGGSGAYAASVIVGADVQREGTEVDGELQPSNGSRATAENLDGSALVLADGIDRLASVGRFAPSVDAVTGAVRSDLDFFRFTLEAGQSASIVMAVEGDTSVANLRMALFDDSGDWAASAGQIVAAAVSSPAADRIILDYTNHSDSAVTLFARPRGDTAARYSLVVTRGASFDIGATPDQPQALGPTGAVLGHLADGGDVGTGLGGGVGPITGSPATSLYVNDGSGHLWDVYSDGDVNNGTSDAYDGGLYLQLTDTQSGAGASFAADSGTLATDGRTLALTDSTTLGLQLDRRIYVPADDGFARYLDQVTNTGATTRTVTLTLNTNLGSDGGTNLIATDAAEAAAYDQADHWLVTDDIDGQWDPSMAHVVWGDGGQAPDLASLSVDRLNQRWTVTLAPGQTIGLLHFAVQADNQATARATAERLVGLPPEVLTGLSAAELASIVNFRTAASDAYHFWANAGDELALGVQAVGGGALPFALRLVDPEGVVRLDTGLPEGPMAGLSTGYTVQTSGRWTVQVLSSSAGGEYLLQVDGATGTPPAPQVVTSSPADGQAVNQLPYIDVTFDNFIRSDSAQADDMVLDSAALELGLAVQSVEVRSGKTLRFHLNGAPLVEGWVGWQMADGAVQGHDGQGSQAASGGMWIDLTGPGVLGATAGTMRAPLQSVQFWLSENLDMATVGVDDIAAFTGPQGEDLRGQIQSVSVEGGVVTVNLARQTAVGAYSITLGGQLRDLAGNLLDQDQDGTGGEAGDDSFTTTIVLTQVDLAIDSVTPPEALITGQSATVSYELRNGGDSVLPAGSSWTDRIWLQDMAGASYFVGNFGVYLGADLAPGATVTITQQILVPTSTSIPAGAYHVLVLADAYGNVDEVDEGNNQTRSDATLAFSVLRPDLVVRDITVPAAVDGGNNLTLTWTDFNQGSGNAGSGGGSYHYYDRIDLLDASGTVVNTWTPYFYTNGDIEAGTGEARSYTISVPNYRPEGDYRVRITTDTYNYVQEVGNENNNSTESAPFTVRQFDLQTVAVSASASTVTMGNQLTVSWEVRNTGSAAGSGGWYDQVQLIDPATGAQAWGAAVYVSPSLPAGGSYTNSYTFTVPVDAALAKGEYIVRVVADHYGYRGEGNEGNNARDAENRLTIVKASVPDLVVTDVTPGVATIAANLDLALSWTVANQGDAATTRGYYDDIFLVDAGGNSTYLTRLYQSGTVAAGSSLTRQAAVRVPHTLPVGNYTVRVVTDSLGSINELLNEGNNTGNSGAIAVTTAIVPDLRIDSIQLPQQITLGQPLTLNWTGSNIGTGDVAAGSGWYERVEFLRASDNASVYSTYVWVSPSGGVAAGGGSYTGTITFTPPLDATSLPEGNYRIRVTADGQSPRVNESNDNNNAYTAESLVPLVAAPTPDLVSVDVSVPGSAPANTRITVTWTDRNDGDAATASGYYSRIELVRVSNGGVYWSNDQYFAEPATIAVGGTATRSQEIVLPSSLAPGAYRVRVTTDPYGYVSEYDRENNNQAQSVDFTVTEAIRADLSNARITSELPASATFGSSLTLTYAVDNTGTGSTQNVQWTDRVRLVRVSDGAEISATTITSGNSGTGVAAGGSYSNTVTLSLPLTAGVETGDYRIEVITDQYAALNEANRSNNNGSSPLQVSVPALANLVVRDVVAPEAATAGLPVDVSWVVDNTGTGGLYLRYGSNYNYFHDRVYLYDASGTTQIADLGAFQVNGPFAADAEPLARVQRVTLPDSVVNGSYRIVVVTDVLDYINEHDGEGADNRAVSAVFTVTQPPRVDLQVDTVSVPAQASAGGTLSLTWRTRNAGSADFVGSFREQVQISPVADFSSGVQTLSPTLQFSGSITAGSAAERSADITLPISVNGANEVSKTWFVRVVTDTSNQVYEYNLENNNASTPGTTVITRPALPDLVVTVADAPAAAVAGSEVVVTYTVTNNGTADAGPRTDRVRLNVESGSAWALQVDNAVDGVLAAGASQTLTVRIALPVNSGNTGFSGRLRAQVTADIGANVVEYPFDDNNTRLDTDQMLVTLPPLANLTVGNIVAPVDALTETEVPLRWTITNSGAAATGSGWTDQLYLSADGVIDASDRLLGSFSAETVLAAGASIERVQTVTLPRDLVGTWRLLVRTDAGNQLYEGPAGEGDNVGVDADTFTTRLRPLPNLVVSSVTPPENAFSGQNAVVHWTVANTGTGATSAPVWHDRVYLSLDDTLDNADTLLASAVNPGYLDVGGAYANSAEFTLPRGIDGNYRFIVVTDADQQLFEGVNGSAAEADNTSAPAAARVTLTPPPDLKVSLVSAPPQAFSGEPVTVNWTVLNDGEGRTRETSWADRVYLSVDDRLDAGDTQLGDFWHAGALSTGESYNGAATVTLPIGVAGPFYFIVATDIYGSVYEHTSENNNSGVETTPTSILLTPPPDLEIVDAAFADTARAGTTYSVQLQVENLGGTATPERQAWWYDQVWLSLDDHIDASDLSLGTAWHYGVVADGSGYTAHVSGQLPSNLQGEFKLLARLDNGNQLFEGAQGDANNTQVLGAVSVYQSRPDLVVDTLSLPPSVEAGRTALFSWTVTNQGNGDTIAASWTDSLWVSLDDALGDGNDVLIGSVAHQGVLAPGASYTVDVAPALPFALKGAGRFYVRTDAGAQITESAEANNVSAVVQASIARRESDLTVSEAVVTPVAGDDRSFDLHFVVRNDGIAATHLNAWNDGVWLSTDGVIGAGDTRVKTVYRGNPLAAGDSYTVDLRITVPASVPEGSFKVLVRADEDSALIESAENNNVAQAQVSIGGLPSPDGELPIGGLEVLTPQFTVVAVDAPEAAFSGQQVTVRWTVRNDGDAAVNPYWWSSAYDQVFLSSDPFLDSGDISLGYASWGSQAGGGNEVERSLDVTLPVGRAGPFYVLVKADAGNRFAEGSELDNTGFDPALLDVTLAPPADLVAGTISLPANAQPGQAMDITYTVNNASTNAALGAWRDTLYLSRDDVLDTGDVVFGSVDVYGPVAGGTAYSRTVHATVPGVDPGEYKLIVRSDVRNVLVEASEANNLSASVDAVTLDVPALTLGQATTGTLAAGQSLFFKVTVGAGEALRFTLDGPGDDVAHDLWVSHASVPSRSRNDVGSGEQYTPDPVLTVPTTEAGVYYVRVDAGFASGAYSLRADLVPFTIERVSKDTVGNAGEATLRVDGARFDDGTRFQLVAADGRTFEAVAVSLRDAGRAYVTFDLFGAELGQYDLRALRVDTATGATVQATLADSVTVIEGEGPDAFLSISGPTAVQVNRDASFVLNYSNDGDGDTRAPLIIVTPSNGTQIGLSSKTLGTEPLFLLGTSLDGPIDLLRPGARYSLPVAYRAPGEAGFLSIQARPVQSDSTETIADWALIERALRPAGVQLAAWQTFWARVQPTLGSTMGELVDVLNDMAKRLSPAGDPIRDVRALFAAQMALDATWRPASAITGQLRQGNDAAAVVAGQTVTAWAPDGDSYVKAGSGVTDADGHFVIGGLTAGSYVLAIDNGAVDQDRDGVEDTLLPSVTVLASADTDAGTLYQQVQAPRPAAQESIPVVAVDEAGQAWVAWIKEDTLWVARRDGDHWVDAQRLVQGNVANVAMVASTKLLDGTGAGVMISWVAGEGNEAELFFAVGRIGGGAVQWSDAVQLTDDAVADSLPRLAVDALGRVTLVYLKEDASIQDDTDLYQMRLTLSAAGLVFTPAEVPAYNGISPESISFTGSWTIWENDFLFPMVLKGEVAIEAGVDGCDYNASIAGGINFEVGSDQPGPDDSAFSSNIKVGIKGNIKAQASWTADTETQDWKFKEATASVNATGEVSWGNGLLILLEKLGPQGFAASRLIQTGIGFVNRFTPLTITNGVKGSLGFSFEAMKWNSTPPTTSFRAPDDWGAVSMQLGAGAWLRATQDGVNDAKVEVSANLNAEFNLLPSLGLKKLSGNVAIEAEYKWFKFSASKDLFNIQSLSSDELMALAADDENGVFTIDSGLVIGTGNVYGDNALFGSAAAATDLFSDGAVALSTAPDGTLNAVWSRTVDPAAGINTDELRTAAYVNGEWVETGTIAGADGFISGLRTMFDASGRLVAVWTREDNNGAAGYASFDELNAARDRADIWYAVRAADGTWGTPQALAVTDQRDLQAALGMGSDGTVMLAWVATTEGADTLQVAAFDGTGFGPATVVATGDDYADATFARIGGSLELYWTTDLRATEARDPAIMSARLGAGGWSTPAGFSYVSLAGEAADEQGGVSATSLGSFNPTAILPHEPVPEDCLKCTPDKIKKIKESAPDCRPGGGSSTTLDPKTCIEKTITYAPCVTRPRDPNDILGPDGFGDEKWIKAADALDYTIRFENAADATAPAQVVTVTQTLDADLDPRSFRVTGFGFADVRVEPTQSRAFYSGRLDLRDTQGIYVDVTVNIDTATRVVTWTFTSIDPATGNVPVDANLGFLLPNDDSGRGDGFVSYTVKPLRNSATGTVIDAQARIVFDAEAPIDTPPIFNTLDAGLPSSRVEVLPATTDSPTFTVRWGGTDATGGSAIRDYEVYVSTDGGAFALWQLATTDTEALFEGEGGHVYAFYSLARDNAGNVEAAPATADASIRVLAQTGSIDGTVFNDIDFDGTRDEGEGAAEGWTVFVDVDADGVLDDGEASVVTAADGAWRFADLQPGTWRIAMQARSGYEITSPVAGYVDVAIAAGDAQTGRSFGTLALGAIGGVQFNDLNGNGQREAGEDGLAGWTVFIDADGDALLDEGERFTVTAADGSYAFANLRPGTYHVAAVTPEGWVQTRPGTASAGQSQTATVVTLAGSLASISLPACACGGTITTVAAQQAGWDEQLVELDQLRADPGYAGVDGSGVRVVVIDTGIDATHPFFDGRVVYQYDFADNDTQAIDRNGHGTHVAGVIAGADALFGGVAQGAELIVLKVFGDDGSGSFANLERALQWVNANAAAWNIGVVNLSLGDGANWADAGSRYGLGDEFAALAAQNVITVAAAGNNYANVNALGVAYPAADPAVLAVGAVWAGDFGGPWRFGNGGVDEATGSDHIASFSQRDDDQVDIFAPGARLTSAAIGGGVRTMQGTSQSAAYVSGVAALAQQMAHQHLGRALTVGEFHTLLASTAVTIHDGDDERDNVANSGLDFGRLDVKALADAIVAMGGGQAGGGDGGGDTGAGDGGTPVQPSAGGGTVTVTLNPGQVVSDADFGAFQLGQVAGLVFDDRDADGVRDDGEAGIAGATVFIDTNGNGQADDGETTVTTDAQGHWQLGGLRAGTLTFTEALPAGWARGAASGSHTVTVSSGLNRNDLDFGRHDVAPVAQDDSASTVADRAVSGNVLDNDSDPGRADLALLTVSLVSGPAHGTLTLGSNGAFTYTPASGYEGTDSFRYAVSDGVSQSEATVTLTVRHDLLRVQQFRGGHDGFTVGFSRPVAVDGLDIDGLAGDIVVTNAAGQVVAGSLFVAPDGLSARFLASGGVLADGTYTVRLRAGAEALRDTAGVLLDGDADGSAGGDWVGSFGVTRGNAVTVGLADTARGAGQALGVAIGDTGLAVRLSNGTGVTSVRFTLAYDPALLGVATLQRGSGLPAGATFSATSAGNGLIAVEISAAAGLPAGALTLAQLVATVPAGASYGAAGVIDVRELLVNGGAQAALDDDAVHVAAFAGDLNRDRQHSAADVTLMRQLLAGGIGRLPGWALVDGRLLGDVNGSGSFDAVDPLRLEQALAGTAGITVPIPGAPVVPPATPPVIRVTVPPRVVPPIVTPRLASTPLSTVTPLVSASATITANASIRVTL
ncbi:CARDB domain-containing protein [Ideonella sp. DXS22W]|uniref:CARDB domain-containing protein n=1 Tax=Pseudaquabacterium inlustre TaxID=2984192 RepID=A0ABU9CCX6_9BURK